MGTHGVSTFIVNSKFASGNLVFYEKAVGRTVTGDILTIAGGTAGYVRVGGTGQDVDFQFYGTGSISAIIDTGLATLTLVGITATTNAALTISLATDATSLTAGALIVAGGIACAKKLFIGSDIDMSVSGTGVYNLVLKTNIADALSIKDSAADIIVFETTTGAPTVTITPATTITGALTTSGGIGNTGTLTVTSANASALAVGRLGATTPALKVDASTATSITGISIKSAPSPMLRASAKLVTRVISFVPVVPTNVRSVLVDKTRLPPKVIVPPAIAISLVEWVMVTSPAFQLITPVAAKNKSLHINEVVPNAAPSLASG